MTFSQMFLGAVASDTRRVYYCISNAWHNPMRTAANIACSPVGLLLGTTVAGCLGDGRHIAGVLAAWSAARAIKDRSFKVA